jgi:hypothetical protein
MADDIIVSRAHIRAKARSAFDAGRARDSHGMNPSAPALFDWLEEYDRCANQMTQFAAIRTARVDVRLGSEP